MRSVEINYQVQVSAAGAVHIIYTFIDNFDLRPENGEKVDFKGGQRPWQYNTTTTILGIPYRDILGGNDQMKVHATWVYDKKINRTIMMLTCVALTSCWHTNNTRKNEDSFYTVSRALDFIRFPLIKPYQCMKILHKDSRWEITLPPENGLEEGIAPNPIKISVIDSVIFAACGDSTIYKGNWVRAAWYIIIPRRKKEESFLTENEFNEYIENNKLPTPQWVKPDDAWAGFNKYQSLPWLEKQSVK